MVPPSWALDSWWPPIDLFITARHVFDGLSPSEDSTIAAVFLADGIQPLAVDQTWLDPMYDVAVGRIVGRDPSDGWLRLMPGSAGRNSAHRRRVTVDPRQTTRDIRVRTWTCGPVRRRPTSQAILPLEFAFSGNTPLVR